MSLRAYNKLLDLLRDSITLNHSKAGGTDPILPEFVVAIGLRWLAGGSYINIRHAYGCSIRSMFRLRTLFIDAVLECESLDIVFPADSTNKIMESSQKFRAISTDGIMRGCVGAIDGLLAVTIRPSLSESGGNPGAYFSGHYITFGLNVQAVCNHDSHFIFFGVMAPGKCSNQVAFERRTSLPNKIAYFPPGFNLVGDAAYQVSDVMIVPFTGAQREYKTKDLSNIFLSQLRIRIKMAFGLLQCKWAILCKPLTASLHMSSNELEACACLHNFYLSEGKIDNQISMLSDDGQFNSIQSMAESPLGWGYLPTVEPLELQPGTSVVRDVIVARLGQMGMHCPPHNKLRRQLELHDINLM